MERLLAVSQNEWDYRAQNDSKIYKKRIEVIFTLSQESLQIQSYLFANKTAQGAPPSLAEQRAWYDVMVEKYAGHPIPLPEGTRVESVKVDGISAEWIYPPDADAERCAG